MDKELIEKILELWEAGHVSLIIVEKGQWVSNWKYEYKETIVQYEGKHYCIDQSRSGSYFTEYEYDDPEVYEVEPFEVTVTQWRKKK